MSFSYSFKGYRTQPRTPDGSFAEGDLLPERLPQENIDECERWNPGCGDLARGAYAKIRELVEDAAFDDALLNVSVSGHFHTQGTAETYVTMLLSVA